MEIDLIKHYRTTFLKLGYTFEVSMDDKKNTTFIEQMRNMTDFEILQILKKGIMVERILKNNMPYYRRQELINFENENSNNFNIIHEYHIGNYVMDAVICINGIPLILIEYKDNDVDRGCLQLQRYMQDEEVKKELKTVQLLVSITKEELKYNTKNARSIWKKWKDENLELFFDKKNILNIIKNYIAFINGKNEVATYHQFIATEKIIEDNKKTKKVYLAPGSGKTTAMLFLIQKLKNKNKNCKILVIVDRLIMQEMLTNKLKYNFLNNVQVANTFHEIDEMINSKSPNIVITTIQKLYKYNRIYLEPIYIIADLPSVYNEEIMEKISIGNFINSTLFVYTNNREKKDEYIYYYSEKQAVQDGMVTPIYYEERKLINGYNIEEIIEDINKNLKDNYKKDKKNIIITSEDKCFEFVNKINQSIATITIKPNLENQDFFEDIIRENESEENYRIESLQNFNEGKLQTIVLSSLNELKEITTQKVERVYLTKQISVNMLDEIRVILNRKSKEKRRGIIIDYFDNKQIIYKYEEEPKVPDVKKILKSARYIYVELLREERNVKNDIENIEKINLEKTKTEVEDYINKVKDLLEKTCFIFSSDILLKQLEETEKNKFKLQINQLLNTMDIICVIYAKEEKNKKQIEQECKTIGITDFKFTPIRKDDLEKYPNLEGAWKKLNSVQKAEAIKNRLENKSNEVETIYKEFIKKEIDEKQYYQKIENIRKNYINKTKKIEIPENLKDDNFGILLYEKMKKSIETKEIQILTEKKLANIIIGIEQQIKQNIKINWKNNIYLWKKIELKIMETLYDNMQKGEILINESEMDKLLEYIKQIALKTIDINTKNQNSNIYYIKKKNAYAMLEQREDGFYVLKNSTTVEGHSKHLADRYIGIMKDLRENGVIKNNTFIKECNFGSLSEAANIILGRSSNGHIEWKDKNGKTYAENKEE